MSVVHVVKILLRKPLKRAGQYVMVIFNDLCFSSFKSFYAGTVDGRHVLQLAS